MTKHSLLGQFSNWVTKRLLTKHKTAEFTLCEPSMNSAAYVRIDTPQFVSQATVWENGCYTIEFAEVDHPEEVYAENGVDLKPEQFDNRFLVLTSFLNKH